jgi:NADPH:quinone reductase-like Zn-dependent oxidoreductase
MLLSLVAPLFVVSKLKESSLMKAIRFHEFGGPEVLKYEDVPDIQPRKDQVLVRVKACALNHLDLFIRKGLPGVKLPHINGSDVSGDIAEVGEYITDLKAGQRVLLVPMTFCGRPAEFLSTVQRARLFE